MFRYRTPTLEDAEALAALGRETFTETFAHLYARADLESYLDEHHTRAAITEQLTSRDVAFEVAETADGALIGYCKVGRSLTLPWQAPAERRVTELRQLYVRAAYHGAGVAHALMAWAMRVLDEERADDVVLSVYSENVRAQRFYARYGFEHVGRFVFMVGTHPDDEYLFHRKLRQ
jgi:ribosomal protein S18 acetylase RimI-like enzyme